MIYNSLLYEEIPDSGGLADKPSNDSLFKRAGSLLIIAANIIAHFNLSAFNFCYLVKDASEESGLFAAARATVSAITLATGT